MEQIYKNYIQQFIYKYVFFIFLDLKVIYTENYLDHCLGISVKERPVSLE